MLNAETRAELRRGWPITVAALAGILVSASYVYVIGVLLAPIEQTFGWTRTTSSSGPLIVSIFVALGGPVAGYAVDRLGPRRIALAGLVILCGAIAALSLTTSSKWVWWGLWCLVGVGSLGAGATVWTAGVASRFDAGRGSALAIALCGSGLCAGGMPFLSATIAEHYGWRGALIGVAAIEAAVALPLAIAFFHGARDQGRRANAQQQGRMTGLPAARALRSRHFFLLGAAGLLFMIPTVGTVFHFAPILRQNGIPLREAAAFAGAIGLATIVGRLSTGFIIDNFRIPPAVIGALAFALPAIGWAGIIAGQFHGIGPLLIAVCIGLGAGAEIDVVAILVVRTFGLRSFGTVFGTANSLFSLGIGLGPLSAAAMFDHFHSYTAVGYVFIPMMLIGAVLLLVMGSLPPLMTTEQADLQRSGLDDGDVADRRKQSV